MPIKPEQLFEAAQELNKAKPALVSDEVCARTMANRAYYSVYLATREAVRVQYSDPTFDVQHTTLAKCLENSPDLDVSAIGTRMKRLKDLRSQADYDPGVTVTKFAVALQLSDAKLILDTLPKVGGRLPTGIPRRR